MNTWMDLGSSRYAHGRDRQNGKLSDRVRGIVKPLVMRRQLSSPAHIQRKKRQERAERGECSFCREPRMQNPKGGTFVVCAKHKSKQLLADKAWHKKKSQAWRELGICISCGKRLSIKATTPGATDTRCGVCSEQQAEAHKRQRSKQKH